MTLTVRPFGAAMRMCLLLLGLLIVTQTAHAACANPVGSAGDMTYSTSANVMVYCDSNNWVSMAGGVSLTVNTSGGGGATPAGSTNDVQYNSSGALAADTGNFTYSSGLLKAPNISATAITASGLGTFGTALVNGGMTVTGQASLTTVSTTLVQLISNTTTACTAGLAGAQRYNSTSNTIDYCSGSAWLSLGPSATVVPAVLAYMSADQTLTQSTVTVLHLDSKTYDSNNNFNTGTYKFTPTIPGYYIVNSLVTCKNMSAVGNACVGYIQKNGVGISNPVNRASVSGVQISSGGSLIVYMNGTTDYLQLAGYTQASGGVIAGGSPQTYFSAALLTMGGTGSGGTATPAGSTGDVQINTSGALDADTGLFYWDKTNHRLGIGTNSPINILTISGTTDANVLSLSNSSPTAYTQAVYYGTGSTWSAGVGNAAETKFGLANKFFIFNTTANSVALAIDMSGSVGISTSTPVAKLDVNGEVRVGNSGLACGSTVSGAMRYTSGTMQVCDGSNWTNVGIGVPQGTISAFAATSCPSGWSEYTAARGRFLRGIDNGAGNDIDGTRSPGATQGDLIADHKHLQSVGTDNTYFYNYTDGSYVPAFGSIVLTGVARTVGGVTTGTSQPVRIGYTSSTIYSTGGGETRPKNVAVIFCQYQGYQSQLATGVATLASLSDVSVAGAVSGSALVYNGSNWTAGSSAATPAGSTNDVQYNNAGALAADSGNFTYASSVLRAPTISATGLNSQYGSVTTLYNPGTFSGNTAALNSVSSTAVSASTISATMIQVGSNGASCGSAISGAMRYTSGTMQVCDGTAWTNVGIGIPQGTISAFALTSCPSGWSEYTAARGRFLRGIDNGASVDPSGTRAPGTTQADALQNITASLGAAGAVAWQGPGGAFYLTGTTAGTAGGSGSAQQINLIFDASRVARTSTETRPVNVAVIFCQYQGYQSQLQTGVATLASLSDVSVAGASTGQVLTYSGGTWVASTTTSNAQGDRITSSTFSIIANPTAYASLSTNGTTWGYLGSAASYLPALQTGTLNAGPVSATVVQTGTFSTACTSPIYGSMRWNATSDTIQICNTAGWTSLSSSSVPNTTLSQGTANYGAIFSGPNTLVTDSALYVDGNHHMGINTTGPLYALTVGGNADYAASAYVSTTGAYITRFGLANSVRHWSISDYGTSQASLSGNFVIADETAGMQRFSIVSSTGNVGIGVGTAAAKLEVNGEVKVGNSGLSCGSTVSGAMRYTSGTMQVCDGTAWTNVGIGIPQGTITAFALTSCPNGWSEYTAARGRFLRGIDNGAGVDPDGTRAPGNVQAATQILQHWSRASGWNFSVGDFSDGSNNFDSTTTTSGVSGNYTNSTGSISDLVIKLGKVRPTNVAVLFCQYQGYQSQLATGVATLASLTDVSVAGAVSGSTLRYNGSSWIAGSSAGTPAGSTGDIQYNNGGSFAADTGNLFWDGTNHRLGIGTNSPAYLLDAVSNSAAGLAMIRAYNQASSGNAQANVQAQNGLGVNSVLMAIGSNGYMGTTTNNDLGIITNNTDRIHVTNAGDVGIGTSSPSDNLTVSGTQLVMKYVNSAAYVAPFMLGVTNNAAGSNYSRIAMGQVTTNNMFIEAADQSNTKGNLLLQPYGGFVYMGEPSTWNVSDGMMRIKGQPGVRSALLIDGNTTTNWVNVRFANSNGSVGTITTNGTATAYNTSSDRRVKENIANTREGLQKLMDIQVRDFSFRKDPSHTIVSGLIAQELNKVYPEAVTTNGDSGEGPLKDTKNVWQVDYGRITPLIVKAVQDLKHLFDADHGEVMKLKAANDNLSILVKSQQKQMDALTVANAKLKAVNDEFAHRLDALEKSALRR